MQCHTIYTDTEAMSPPGRVTRVDASHLPGQSTSWQEPTVVEPPPIIDDDWFEPEAFQDDLASMPLPLPAKLPESTSSTKRRRRRIGSGHQCAG